VLKKIANKFILQVLNNNNQTRVKPIILIFIVINRLTNPNRIIWDHNFQFLRFFRQFIKTVIRVYLIKKRTWRILSFCQDRLMGNVGDRLQQQEIRNWVTFIILGRHQSWLKRYLFCSFYFRTFKPQLVRYFISSSNNSSNKSNKKNNNLSTTGTTSSIYCKNTTQLQ